MKEIKPCLFLKQRIVLEPPPTAIRAIVRLGKIARGPPPGWPGP
jgi:hypothetical protein